MNCNIMESLKQSVKKFSIQGIKFPTMDKNSAIILVPNKGIKSQINYIHFLCMQSIWNFILMVLKRHTRTKIGPCDYPRDPVHRAKIVGTGGTSIFKRESAPRISDIAVENDVVPFIAIAGSTVRRGPLSNPASSQNGIACNLCVRSTRNLQYYCVTVLEYCFYCTSNTSLYDSTYAFVCINVFN